MNVLHSRYGTLVRREFWENRGLWIAPLVAASLMILGCIVLALRLAGAGGGGIEIEVGGSMRNFADAARGFQISAAVASALVLGVGGIAALMYAFDALYAERKDRSILFWKSLPVSDRDTVLSKLAVAVLVMPVGLYLLAVVTHLLGGVILSLNPPGGVPLQQMWQPQVIFGTYGQIGGRVFTNILWFLPVFSYALLASVVATKSPLLTGVLPFLIGAAVERVVFGSSEITRFVRDRLSIVHDGDVYARPGLWAGLAVAAGILYIVIRLRRYRDDS
jgi:ABC-2 type transport system permease protein